MRRAVLWIVVATVAFASGCRVRVSDDGGACTHLQATRKVRGLALCEDAWTCERPPGTEIDRVGLHRLALCDGATGPVVFYLPGMHMNGALPFIDPRYDVRVYLAQAGIRVWSIDYRTHTVPPDASPATLRTLGRWDIDVFTGDAVWAIGFQRALDPGQLVLMGFSFGGGFAYRLASREDVHPTGLVILDAAAAEGRAESGEPVIDVGSARLAYAERARLLDAVIANPDGPSPIPGYASAEAALADILFTSKSFGGDGGLSAAKDGVSEIEPLAHLLRMYDRWWPRGVLTGAAPKPPGTPLPVLAFSSTRMGPQWTERVEASARQWGGAQAQVRMLPDFGHLDVLVGRAAPHLVFEPIRRWLVGGSPGK